jgi:hypothetical protein
VGDVLLMKNFLDVFFKHIRKNQNGEHGNSERKEKDAGFTTTSTRRENDTGFFFFDIAICTPNTAPQIQHLLL